jgi:hypothetical protein
LEQSATQVFKLFSTPDPAAGPVLRVRAPIVVCAGLVLISFVTGCATVILPPADLSQPGWTTRQGQAIWRPGKYAPELAGDLLVATRPDGSSVVQFTKTPLPFVSTQTTTNAWQIRIIPAEESRSGHGAPPSVILWFFLPRCFAGSSPPKPWQWEALDGNSWRLSNPATGESLEGYLTP